MAAEDSDIAIIDAGYKLLASKDYIIKDISWAELREDADFRYQSTRVQNLQDFLNSVDHPDTRAVDRRSSHYTRALKASKRVKIKCDIIENQDVSFIAVEDTVSDRRTVFAKLRNLQIKLRITSLLDLHKHQEKTNASIAAAKEFSHFFTDVAYTHFRD